MSAPIPTDDEKRKPDPVKVSDGFSKFVVGLATTLIEQIRKRGMVSAEQLRELALRPSSDPQHDMPATIYDAVMAKLLQDRVLGQCGDILFVVTVDGNNPPVDTRGMLQ
jgi:hypothetical protein